MLALLLACQLPSAPGTVSRDTPGAAAWAIGRQAPKSLELPQSVRPDDAPAPETVPITGPFVLTRTVDGIATWEAPLPARPRSLFFTRPPSGMRVETADGKVWSHSRKKQAPAETWAFSADTVLVRTAGEPPESGELVLRWPTAQEREDALNLATFSADPTSITEQERFTLRSVQVGEDTRTGLLLPAPSRVVYGGRALAENATLSFEARVLPPEFAVPKTSDGSDVLVWVQVPGQAPEEVWRGRVEGGSWRQVRVDLSPWEGQVVDVILQTQDSVDTTLDYVFLADPVIYTPVSDPKRMVLVFLDTTRPDHMGMYGYERDTTPKLDAWAQDAAIFENARSVAPWTLPSARSALTGRQPEHWESGQHVAEVLAEQGYATSAAVGNVYLSANFDMAQGWSSYSVENWPTIDQQVDKLQSFIERNPDRDSLLLLHTMDMHLPYTEPVRYRRKWASAPPDGLSWNSTRTPVMQAARKNLESTRQWVIDRYDQNLRFTDDVLSAFLEELGDQNTWVLIFADHGEEFWDHDGFEHGHSLYDELLRVPFVVKGPGVPAGRVDAPISLLDLTPTVLDLLDVEVPSGLNPLGRSVLPAASGDAEAIAALEARPHAVGRPLYGDERWGVIHEDQKWSTYRGEQVLVDLSADPLEATDLAGQQDLSAHRQAMGQALETEAPVSWRIVLGKGGNSRHEQVLRISHPAGIQSAWLGQDPLKATRMAMVGPDESGAYEVVVFPEKRGQREIYVVPAGDPTQLEGLSLQWVDKLPAGDVAKEPWVAPADQYSVDNTGRVLQSARVGPRNVTITWGFAPVPNGKQIDGTDDELTEALEAMGYTSRDHE